jgi:hypothetical protein
MGRVQMHKNAEGKKAIDGVLGNLRKIRPVILDEFHPRLAKIFLQLRQKLRMIIDNI